MAICYDLGSAAAGSGKFFDPRRIDPNKGYLRHYDNYLLLRFTQVNGTTLEKAQATRELDVCERKLRWHRGHPAFDAAMVDAECRRMAARWGGRLGLPKATATTRPARQRGGRGPVWG